uniref:Uncharacterized protein n=1 Tax=Parastrongyloides trichosuri TaxID=131310 RepID=A0A0N5A470_PARTI
MNQYNQELYDAFSRINVPTQFIELGLYIGLIQLNETTISSDVTSYSNIDSNQNLPLLSQLFHYSMDNVYYEFTRRIHIALNRDPKKKRNPLGNITSFTINAEKVYRML